MATEVDDEPGTELAEKLMAATISQDAGFLLAKLHAGGSVLNNRALAEFGLKERSYSVLALANSELEPTQREMAEFLSLDPSQIVALIDELEKRGLVVRAPGKQDRRAKIVSSTPEGDRRLPAGRGGGPGRGIRPPWPVLAARRSRRSRDCSARRCGGRRPDCRAPRTAAQQLRE